MIKSKSGRTPKVKARLRQAALRLFSERGIDDTPVKDIVRAAQQHKVSDLTKEKITNLSRIAEAYTDNEFLI